jgi:hypothetical protein
VNAIKDLEARAVAGQACPTCGAQPGSPCTRTTGKGGAAKTVELKHPHVDRAAALGARLGAEAQQRVDAGRQPASQPAPAGPVKYDHCSGCGLIRQHPWENPVCGSAKACQRRQAVNAAEAELGLELTVWDQRPPAGQKRTGHELARAARAAEEAIAQARAARKEDATG